MFRDAIAEYEKALSDGKSFEKAGEVIYNIGLCYTYLKEMDNAILAFNEVLSTKSANSIEAAFAEYGLAWVEVHQGKYKEAISRLQKKLDSKSCPDYEQNAVMLFKIGKIYLKYLKDFKQAEQVFTKVLATYPEAKILNPPYFENVK